MREQIPVTINVPKLIKDIGKEIRHAERYIIQLNPPKPERESKRKRKKPVNKDFVDYSLLPKGTSQDVSVFILYFQIFDEFLFVFSLCPSMSYPRPQQLL